MTATKDMLQAAIEDGDWALAKDLAHDLAVAAGQIFDPEEDHGDLDADLDSPYLPGVNAGDTRDSRGLPLRPAVNDAGEPWWM